MKTCTEVRVYRAIAHALVLHGIRTMFGLIGDANLFMVDSFVRHEGGRFLAANHEGSAVLVAHGHAQTQGRIGVATITHGPGRTNAVTALVEAVRFGTSMVVLSGDTLKDKLEHLQQLNQPQMITATGAGLVLMRGTRIVYQDVARALTWTPPFRCLSGRVSRKLLSALGFLAIACATATILRLRPARSRLIPA